MGHALAGRGVAIRAGHAFGREAAAFARVRQGGAGIIDAADSVEHVADVGLGEDVAAAGCGVEAIAILRAHAGRVTRLAPDLDLAPEDIAIVVGDYAPDLSLGRKGAIVGLRTVRAGLCAAEALVENSVADRRKRVEARTEGAGADPRAGLGEASICGSRVVQAAG